MSAVHVAFSLLTLFPGRVGGSEANVQGLLREFSAGNGPSRVSVLANALVMEAYRDLVSGPVSLHMVRRYRQGDGSLTRAGAMTMGALRPRRLTSELPSGIDVLHHPVTVPVLRMPGVPTVATVYDLQHREMPGLFTRAERAYRRWAYEGAARRADLVITTSEYSRERLVEIAGIPADRVVSVAMGIDVDRFRPDPGPADATLAERLSLPERYVVYPANLWPHKNHRPLVDALAKVADDELHLLLTGQDYGRGDGLREHARRAGVDGRVRHLGFLSADDVPALYRKASAMIFPSLYEGFGSPPLEAMACGCPVASSTRGSLADVVGSAALTFNPESVEEIAASIARIAEDETLRSRLREAGLARASRFTWGAAARRHCELYELARTLAA
jgi:glycosyltransferase involved in cell wall biosynthesis